jgi:hypothetical protein
MKTKSKKIALILPVILLIAFFTIKFWAQEECVEFRENFNDSFNTTDWKDHDNSSVYWPGAGFAGSGEITLNRLGANFAVAEPSGMGARIYVCDAGDFDADGFPDIVGLEIFPGDPYSNRLLLCRNHFEDLDADGYDDDGVVLFADFNEIYDTGFACGPASISVADYNNDGLLDFFFMKNRQDEFAYTEFVASMFINVGTPTDPDFVQYQTAPNLDFTNRFMSENIYINWAADHISSVDIDADGDVDVLVISEDKIFLVRNPGPTNFDIGQFDISELNYDFPTGFTTGRGGSTVDAADLDHDGDIDVIGGSVMDIPYLVYYENDSQGNFTRHTLSIPIAECTGSVATCVYDFNLDGYIDIFAGTDRWNAGNEARMWFMKNTGSIAAGGEPDFIFRCLNNCNPILPDPHDVDMSAMLDFDQDGDMDVILADANHSGDYYLIINELADVYVLHGEAWSNNVTPHLDPGTQAITRVRLTRFDQHVRGGSSQGLSVELYVSNNNGRDWEYLTRFDDDGITNLPSAEPWHYFTHFGSQLKWKAILMAEEDNMDEFDGASFETPVLEYIRLRYSVVDRREYSRTSVAARLVDDSGENVKLIIGGTFYFPGWQGHLRAYDVTNVTAMSSSDSVLRTITRPDLGDPTGRELVAAGVNIRWDAGQDLMARAPSSRVIYTSMPDGTGTGYTREDFTVANVGTLQGELNDFQNDHAGLIQFVRGEGRDWILGDINHSNPALAGPPAGEELKMGSGYAAYMTAWEDRPKVLFVGANAGMIHCFSVLTGEELWAFIPHNLISKMRNMWPVDAATGDRYFARDVYVDGSPVVADVYFDDAWHTILVCGQGPGQGKAQGLNATGNYYFALDITDIDDPQPMWEFTDVRMGETWSTPVIGRILNEGTETWTAFMGSGYDNVPAQGRQGHRFYAVDVETGQAFWYFNANPEINTRTGVPDGVIWPNDKNVLRSIPGSPNMVDTDGNGSIDAVYVGDLEGRMWKVNVGIEYLDSDPWVAELMYEDPDNYPIITKPEVWLNVVSPGTPPRIYFGTGGDDKAPADAIYSFIAMIDDETPEVEWFLGDPNILSLPVEKHSGDLTVGEKVWADPKQANNIVYFSTLTGNIETVDPCQSLVGIGRLYARFVKPTAGTPVGGTAFREAGGQLENIELAIKTRAAVTLGESEDVSGMQKREVYIQEYDSTIQKLEQPIGALLKIKSWREIYRIIK